MLTNREYFEMLTKKEQKQFKDNFKSNRNDNFYKWLKEESKSFIDFISKAFYWNHSHEKHEYWDNISKKYNV